MPFGPVTNFVLTKKSGQTLIEMANEEIATKMLEYYQLYPPRFKAGSETAILQYSKYSALEITGISRPVAEAITTANEYFIRFVTEHPTPPRVLRVFLEPTPQTHLNYMDYFKGLRGQTLSGFEASSKLRIEFSRQRSLELRQNDNTSRDFVAKPLTSEEEEALIKSLPPI